MEIVYVGDTSKGFLSRNRLKPSDLILKEKRRDVRETKGLKGRKEVVQRFATRVSQLILIAMLRRKDRRPTTFHSCGEDNGLELGRVSQRRVKIGLRLAGSHYNNYGRVARKLHATVPLTVSPG